jgi:hypothetical protein
MLNGGLDDLPYHRPPSALKARYDRTVQVEGALLPPRIELHHSRRLLNASRLKQGGMAKRWSPP